MTMKKYLFILFTPFILISGCSNGEDKTTPEQSSKEHIFKSQERALNKAKEVEKMLQKEAEKRRQAIEEQSK